MPAHIVRFTPKDGGDEVPMALPAAVTADEAIQIAKNTARDSFNGEASLWLGVQLHRGITDTSPPRLVRKFKARVYTLSVTWPQTTEVRQLRWRAFDMGEARELSLKWADQQGIARDDLTFLEV